MSRAPTQSDVAKACRVSRSTVAAVMQSRPSTSVVSARTRKRVLDAAKRLNYRPHFAASSLKAGRTNHIAIAVPTVSALNGTITSQILMGAMSRARELNYSLVVCTYEEDHEEEASFEDLVRTSRFDGFFYYFGGGPAADDRRVQLCAQWDKPCVLLQGEVPGVNSVCFDDVAGGRLAMRHLIEVGCSRVAVIADSPGRWYAQRLRGALAEAAQAGVEALALPLGQDMAVSAREAIDTLMMRGQGVDGIYGGADQVAMACIQELHRRGLSVPGDVAVIGHDDGPWASLASPPLSSIRIDGQEMGRRVIDLLYQQIEQGGALPLQHHTLEPTLVVRQSSVAA